MMAATTQQRPSFVDNLWDGVEQIKEKTDMGLKSCRDVLDFFKRLATLEEEYSKNISNLLQRYQPTSSSLTLSQGWKGVITVLEGQAGVHKSLSTNFVTNLCHPLQALLKDMENRRKQLVVDSGKQKVELRDHIELVKKAKAKYDKSSKDLEGARSELAAAKSAVTEQDPQLAKISKMEKNVTAKEADTNTSETQYKLQVQASNTFLDSYQGEKWPYILNEFEQFEITRISFMKANIHNFMGLLKEMPSVIESEVQAGLRSSEQIDPEVDLQMFIEANKTPKELLSPFVFESYQVAGPRSLPASRPISQIWDNFRLLGSKEEPKAPSIFGVSLMELMEKQQKEEPNLPVPKPLSALSEGIISLNGFTTEGLFRLAGSSSEVQNLRKQFDKGDYSITSNDAHVLAAVYKQFLRELPEAVIPTEYYELCVSNEITPKELFEKLPPLNKTVLLYILNFLQIFTKPAHLQYNKMTPSNLSTIFATILLRSPQKEPTALLAGLTNELSFVEKLILTAPALDPRQFPIFTLLHQPSHVPPSNPASKQATAITSFAFSPPTSPASLTVTSTLGDVAYSTATDPSCTSFEDMSSKDDKDDSRDDKDDSRDDQISDFSEPEPDSRDHFADEDRAPSSKDDSKTSKGDLKNDTATPTATPATTATTSTTATTTTTTRQLGLSEELPEFVFVPTSQQL